MKINCKKTVFCGNSHQAQRLESTAHTAMVNNQSKRRKIYSILLALLLVVGISACKPNGDGNQAIEIKAADGSKPTLLSSYIPDSGGIATPMIIRGENFGTDTAKLKVLFVSELRDASGKSLNEFDTVPGSIITSNGTRIYLVVPQLTYKKDLQVIVSTIADNGEKREKVFKKRFNYKTETAVTTVAGQTFADANTAVTKGGTLSTASFSCPMFLAVDAEKNVIVVERSFAKAQPEMDVSNLQPKTEARENMAGTFLMLNEKDNRVDFMQKAESVNAPTVSPDGKEIYIPADAGGSYYVMKSEENYTPRLSRIKPEGEYKTLLSNNWKFSFVTYNNKKDPNDPNNGMIYTIMYNKQLVQINPRTNRITVISNDIGTKDGSDTYLIFSPKQSNVMYASVTNKHSIYKLTLEKKRNEKGEIDPNATDTVRVEPYAGQAINNKAGNDARGWADGGLKDAKFNYPRQLTFDKEGILYIADCVNHCIRTIDTRIPDNSATVRTLVGIPGDKGNVDGGPELAKLAYPMGLAVSFDGTIYIADTRNYSIRKLAIQ